MGKSLEEFEARRQEYLRECGCEEEKERVEFVSV
jgi:hypothetical protein